LLAADLIREEKGAFQPSAAGGDVSDKSRHVMSQPLLHLEAKGLVRRKIDPERCGASVAVAAAGRKREKRAGERLRVVGILDPDAAPFEQCGVGRLESMAGTMGMWRTLLAAGGVSESLSLRA